MHYGPSSYKVWLLNFMNRLLFMKVSPSLYSYLASLFIEMSTHTLMTFIILDICWLFSLTRISFHHTCSNSWIMCIGFNLCLFVLKECFSVVNDFVMTGIFRHDDSFSSWQKSAKSCDNYFDSSFSLRIFSNHCASLSPFDFLYQPHRLWSIV